jgi:hypothetical protein
MERAKRSGGLHKRSAEDWGYGLWARGAELPLEGLAVAFREMSCGRDRSAEAKDVYYRPGSPSITRWWTESDLSSLDRTRTTRRFLLKCTHHYR